MLHTGHRAPADSVVCVFRERGTDGRIIGCRKGAGIEARLSVGTPRDDAFDGVPASTALGDFRRGCPSPCFAGSCSMTSSASLTSASMYDICVVGGAGHV